MVNFLPLRAKFSLRRKRKVLQGKEVRGVSFLSRSLRFPNFTLKLKLGVLLLCSSFLLNYQPAISFPPVKSNVVYAEITQEQSVSSQASPVVFQLPHPGYITTHFSSFHPGIDLCSGLGMPIKPVTKGIVVEAGYNFFGLGLMVEVEHEGGYRSTYGHMGKIFVSKGQSVSENDFLGEIGMTGNTSGPHTHLEISKDGRKIDPLLLLPEIRSYPVQEDFAVVKSATPSAITVPAPVGRPASASGNVNSGSIKTEAQNIISTAPEAAEIKPASEKVDLGKQTVRNILNLTTPKPTPTQTPEVPAGGKLSFSLFGLKR